jgi:hypothetical protein
LVREGKTWQVVVWCPDRIEVEDVPPDVAAVLAGAAYFVNLSVEPITAPASARSLAWKTARAIAKATHGVVLDPQGGSVTTPAGVRRFVAQKRPARFSLLEMSWWFTDGPLLSQAGLDAFLDTLAKHLPEALPKRYGLYEPPQHRFAETGLDHFRDFLAQHAADGLVWYPHRPVMSVHVRASPQWGVGRLGFACGYCSLAVEQTALRQPGWQALLGDLFARLSPAVRPFYGEVRTLAGFVPMGATYGSDMQTAVHPIGGGRWRGVPRDPGHACVCGPDYLSLWPAFRDEARIVDGLGFVGCEDWLQGGSVLDIVGTVPAEIAQRHTPSWRKHHSGGWSVDWNHEYPPRWPFGDPPPLDHVPGW